MLIFDEVRQHFMSVTFFRRNRYIAIFLLHCQKFFATLPNVFCYIAKCFIATLQNVFLLLCQMFFATLSNVFCYFAKCFFATLPNVFATLPNVFCFLPNVFC
jgi:hypothetical protein